MYTGTSITLPDTISFEEIALKWCEWHDDIGAQLKFRKNPLKPRKRSIKLRKNSDGIYAAFNVFNLCSKRWTDVARFFFDEKKLEIIDEDYFVIDTDYDGSFHFILDYIKERSNG